MATAARLDPYLSFRFEVTIDEIPVAGFSEVSGLDFESVVETCEEGGELKSEQQLMGPTKFPSRIVLKRGVVLSEDLWSWYRKVRAGRIIRKQVSIALRDSAGKEERRWSFREAVPVKWTGPQLRASSSEVAIETLEL